MNDQSGDQFRNSAAWVSAVAALLLVYMLGCFVGRKLGIPVVLDVDPYTINYGRGAEIESDSIRTSYGWGMFVLSILAAVAVWHRVKGRQLTSGAQAQFRGWLLGSSIMTLGGIPIWYLLNADGLAARAGPVLELGLLAVSVWAGIQMKNRLESKPS
ncbi:hypothetical protein ACVWW4_000870 [Bradyrhizobium sp. LB7.1]